MYIFIDESGDIGSGNKSSRHFLLLAVICHKTKPLEKIVTSIRAQLKKKFRNIQELHAYHSSISVRRQLLLKLVDVPDVQLAVFIFKKSKRQNSEKNFYMICAKRAITELLNYYNPGVGSPVEIFFDQRDTKRSIREELIATIKNDILTKCHPKVFIVSSHTNKCIQVADFVAWSVFRKYELQDTEYYNIIKDLIVLEKEL